MRSATRGQDGRRLWRLLVGALGSLVLAGGSVALAGIERGNPTRPVPASASPSARRVHLDAAGTRADPRSAPIQPHRSANPATNVTPDPAYTFLPTQTGSVPQTGPACWREGSTTWVPAPTSAACLQAEVQATDAARASEGLAPVRLPAGFGSLSPADQLLVLVDVERVSRGEQPVVGVAPVLSGDATLGATTGSDPRYSFSTVPSSTWWGSNWATGVLNALDASYTWMYADGPGGYNVACPRPGAPGCWGHRDNILTTHPGTLVMGAAAVPAGTGLLAVTELFVAVRQPKDVPPLSYTWAEAVAAGAGA